MTTDAARSQAKLLAREIVTELFTIADGRRA